jgi:hydroxyisourate hydrolase
MSELALSDLNALDDAAALDAFLRCCGSASWAARMAAARPFTDTGSLYGAADVIWWGLAKEDWLEALAAHPRIGSRSDVAAKSGVERAWAEGEQSGTQHAGDVVLDALAEANAAYEARFGHVYVVCATGKSATEMLELCRARLLNDPETELRIAAEEQRKITHIRLGKLLGAAPAPKPASAHVASITTHVLDTARGRPARGVPIVLSRLVDGAFREVGRGETDDDGRLKTLVPKGTFVAGTYRLVFEVSAYEGGDGFFPEVAITFVVRDATQHHHVPLLLSPFGYSTYRGS